MSEQSAGRPDDPSPEKTGDQPTGASTAATADARDVDGLEDDTDVRVVDRRWWARSEDSDDGQTDRSDKPSYVEDLEKQLADKDALLKEYAAKYRAAAAEFDGTRARLRKEIAKDIDREKRKVLASFLEVVDNVDRAIDASREASTDNPGALSVLQGVKMVRQQFLTTLDSYGVTRIDAAGQPFDPNLHDAVSTVPVTDTTQEDTVIDVVKPGYYLNDDVLRPAAVTVGKLAPGSG